MAEDAPTTLMFPLRTSVELFRDPASPAAEVRAKQGAVLYDRLIFEGGLFDATITTGGSNSWWKPGADASDAELREARQLIEEGGPMQLAVGKQPSQGVAAKPEDMHVMMQGNVTRHYVAEWESVLRSLERLKPDWVERFDLPNYAIPPEAKREIGKLNFSCLGDKQLMPEADPWTRDFTYKAFHHDAVIASRAGAAFNITSQFEPMLGRAGVNGISRGEMALEVWASNLSELPWETVLEFREHPGAEEARAKLRDLEDKARETEPQSLEGLRVQVGNEITDALTGVIEELRPRVGLEAVRQTLHTGVSILVPIAAPAASLAEVARQSRRFARSWHAALMTLRRRPER